MNNNSKEVLINLIWAIAVTLIGLGFLIYEIFVIHPSISVNYEIGNNTLEAVKSINWSALPR